MSAGFALVASLRCGVELRCCHAHASRMNERRRRRTELADECASIYQQLRRGKRVQ